MPELALALDCLVLLAAFFSAFLWLRASRHRLRRVSRHEVLDAADINRIVIALNRTQILNSRAALSTACVAALATLRFLLQAAQPQ
jgi:hypothetical protein